MRLLHTFQQLLRQAFASEAPHRKLNFAALALLSGFVAVAPFPYGGIMPAGKMAIELFAFGVAAAAFLSDPRPLRLGLGGAPAGAVTLIAVIGVIQLLPLPQKSLKLLSVTSAQIYHETGQILTLSGARAIPKPRVSIAPTETAGTILLFLACIALFLSSAKLLHNRFRRRLLLLILLATAMVQIIGSFLGKTPPDRIRGAFANPNHFAAYLEIVLAVAFGGLWAEILMNRERGRNIAQRSERFGRRLPPLALRILAWGLIATGIALTQSRGGIFSAAATTFVLLTLAVLHRSVRPRRLRLAMWGVLALVAGICLAAAGAGSRPMLRFVALDPRDIGGGARLALWKTSLHAWQEFPLLGSGLGSFREAFRRVQPRELEGLVEQAHSDLLQLLVTSGWVGASLGILALASSFLVLGRLWRRQRHREESALILAGFGSLLSLTIHGIAESNFSVPAIPATLACVLGAAWAAGRSESMA